MQFPQSGASMRLFLLVLLFSSFLAPQSSSAAPSSQLARGGPQLDPRIEAKVEALLQRMTLEEKVGQLNFPSYSFPRDPQLAAVRKGRIGAMLNVAHPDHIKVFKDAAAESRLKIPLIFAIDSIFAFHVTFPVPIAWAATWEPSLAESATEAIARETSAIGINLTFAPMVDISRDPRWGRVIEGAGEDAFLGAAFAAARVRGYRKGGLATSAKHFVGYGAPEGGRDYNGAQISLPELLDRYVPPFKAAIDAGSETVMASFNTVNGVPVTAERRLVTALLKERLGFNGLVMSDFAAISELVNHGVAADLSEAARKAILAGIDLDMEGKAYDQHLADEVAAGRVPIAAVDEAARRVLRTKYRMGLFDEARSSLGGPVAPIEEADARKRARKVARESFVLLKNDHAVLPLQKTAHTVALIGSAATMFEDHSWYGPAGLEKPVAETLKDALEARLAARGQKLLYEKGFADACGRAFEDKAAAVKAARASDVVVLVLIEDCDVSGEGASRTSLGFSGVQQEMLEALAATGRPLVLVAETGRPLTLTYAHENVAAILVAWHPGTEGRTAIAEVLTGEVNPSGKLPMTFLRSVGQIPLSYNELPTSRPANGTRFTTGYVDEQITPLYPFGHGLSYTTFEYSDLKLSTQTMTRDGAIDVAVTVANTGGRMGREVVQLYTHQHVGQRSRPYRELKGFQKISLAAGEKKTVRFKLSAAELAYHDLDGAQVIEPGKFTVFTGGSSTAELKAGFEISAD
jgi:beta-glucosidase